MRNGRRLVGDGPVPSGRLGADLPQRLGLFLAAGPGRQHRDLQLAAAVGAEARGREASADGIRCRSMPCRE